MQAVCPLKKSSIGIQTFNDFFPLSVFSSFYRSRPQRSSQSKSGQPGQSAGRFERREKQEASTTTANALHVATAARAGGPVHAEQVPGHERQGGDCDVDEPHRTQSQGK